MKPDRRDASGLLPKQIIGEICGKRVHLFPRLQEGVRDTL